MKNKYLLLFLVILSIISIFIGVKEVTFADILSLQDQAVLIILQSRIPRLISIIVAGMSMSICGLIMQQITRNKFVSPTTAATIDSARLGMVVSLIFFSSASTFHKMAFSFSFALAGTFLFMTILKRIKQKGTILIPLLGIMLGNVIDSTATFFAYRYDLIQSANSWLQGNFAMIIKGRYELLYLSIPLVILAFLYSNKFTVAGMGEDFSINLGLNYKQVVNIGIIIVSIISSVVVITVGRIPFLGLIVPNIVSIYQGDHLKKSIWATALLGANFLLACDILSRIIIFPYEIPIGLVVGVIGSFIFLYLLIRRRTA
ncbi:ABC transporter permease [Alkaliphilus transvaalensis]|uniref:ABC transporter permease n=1 Tax=Alkaliphilus transvaalensis TaxID=114628 RepID=UPI00047AA12A|nr:ABC transporter permease [Alkaliphilus transvaalensis]